MELFFSPHFTIFLLFSSFLYKSFYELHLALCLQKSWHKLLTFLPVQTDALLDLPRVWGDGVGQCCCHWPGTFRALYDITMGNVLFLRHEKTLSKWILYAKTFCDGEKKLFQFSFWQETELWMVRKMHEYCASLLPTGVPSPPVCPPPPPLFPPGGWNPLSEVFIWNNFATLVFMFF